MIVDDSLVVAKLTSAIVGADPAIEVAAVAPSGRVALARLADVNPDLVTLDVEMPGMSGLETLVEIRKRHPRLPVIMFSSHTERGAATTLEALALGASDYVTKPAGVGTRAAALDQVRRELVPKIRALCGLGPAVPEVRPHGARTDRGRVDVVAIGLSTGGPNALGLIVPALPADLAAPVLVVQHMPTVFTRLLAERLAASARLPVGEAVPGAVVRAGRVWIAPGDHHMEVVKDGGQVRIALHQGPFENGCRPAVDPLFRSVAAIYGAHVLGVVLTGMGTDSVAGAQAIRDAGGRVLAQDEASSVVWGMPGAVAKAGLAERLVPLDAVAAEIVRRVQGPRGLVAVASA